MERKLYQAFDRQKFQQNKRLAGIIDDVERRYAHVLSDDDLELVSAAGAAEPAKAGPLPSIHVLPEERKGNPNK